MAGKVIINAGPAGSGKSTRSSAWRSHDPQRRTVLDEVGTRSLEEAVRLAGTGKHVMVNILLPKGVKIEVYS